MVRIPIGLFGEFRFTLGTLPVQIVQIGIHSRVSDGNP
jgi:hypothetical protein